MMKPGLRKAMLTAHITFSVGWLGAVAVFLAFAIVGLTHRDAEQVRSAYLAMELSGWFVIVPASLGALLTGLIQSVGTPWGLFKHYWIVVKLVLTVAATILLFVHMQPVSVIAEVARDSVLTDTDLRGLRIQLLADAAAAVGVLLGATILSVYKPWGRIQYGTKGSSGQESAGQRPWGRYVLLRLLGLFVLFVIVHLLGGGLNGH